jgi:Protein of unknown function (DUF3568)
MIHVAKEFESLFKRSDIMRFAQSWMFLAALGLAVPVISGCSTDQPGASYTLSTYTTNVDSSPDKVTTAATKAADDLKLLNIQSSGTTVDGKVTAKTADDRDVTITISQAGDDVSKVAIQVGATGDQAVSAQLMDRIKSHLSWL